MTQRGIPKGRPSMKPSTIKAITGDRDLSEGARLLLFLLLGYADFTTGACYPSNGELLRHLGDTSDRTLKRQIAELKDAGYLTADYDHARHQRLIVVDLDKLERASKEVANRPRAGDSRDTYSGDSRDTKQVPNRVGVGAKTGKSRCQIASGVGVTGDTPNKNTQENTPGTTPERGARPVAPLAESDPPSPAPAPGDVRTIRGPGRKDPSLLAVAEWANGLGSTAGRYGCPLGEWVLSRADDAPASWFRALLKKKCGPGTPPQNVNYLNAIMDAWIDKGEPDLSRAGGSFKVVQEETPFPPYVESWRKKLAREQAAKGGVA